MNNYFFFEFFNDDVSLNKIFKYVLDLLNES